MLLNKVLINILLPVIEDKNILQSMSEDYAATPLPLFYLLLSFYAIISVNFIITFSTSTVVQMLMVSTFVSVIMFYASKYFG